MTPTRTLLPSARATPSLEGTIGGIARAATVIGMTKMEAPDALVLHAGDISIGDLFYTQYFAVAELQLLLGLGVDAMTAGNHEFDLGPLSFPADAGYRLRCRRVSHPLCQREHG